MAEVTGALLKALVASATLALSVDFGCAHAWIEGSMGEWGSAVFDIVEQVVGDLKNTLVDDILMRSMKRRLDNLSALEKFEYKDNHDRGWAFLRNAELKCFEALRQLVVHQLLVADNLFDWCWFHFSASPGAPGLVLSLN